MKKLAITFLLFLNLQGIAQETYTGPENTKVEMADQMRSDGKIYVVVAVLGTVLAGMILYAAILDRRISKLERESSE